MAALRARVPPFLAKMLELLHDRSLTSTVSWSADGHSIVVWPASPRRCGAAEEDEHDPRLDAAR